MTDFTSTCGTSIPPLPSFVDFYRAINGREPFPWQARLARQLEAGGEWPSSIGVPTGLGKTACLDIAIWWLASQADREPAERTAPTRIWWVVNRRLLVDATGEHAEALGKALSDPARHGLAGQEAQHAQAVGDRLCALQADPSAGPLEVIRLRGDVTPRLPRDPSSPAVMLATLPMYGSRLLFRGYGSSRSMRPIDAAMAGMDSLVLLDEAHLAPHLCTLLPALAECTQGARSILGAARSGPRMVTLTATGDAEGPRFELNADDEAHPVVQQRLDAYKPLELCIEKEAESTGQRLAEAALDLIATAWTPAAMLVFANTPATAREAFGCLEKGLAKKKLAGSADMLLLTGRSREREAERTRARVLDPVNGMASKRDTHIVRERHLIVVATQTLEVGADVDAEFLVTESCGVRALTQRLGRLNRLGRYAHARAIYVHVPPPKAKGRKKVAGNANKWPVYGSEPETVLKRLQQAQADPATHTVNLSPRLIADILGSPVDGPGRAPEILPGLLWEWVKTTVPPHEEAPVEPYFSGIAGADYSVSLIWRVHVPKRNERLWPRARDAEAVSVPIGEVLDVLREDEELCRRAPDGVTMEHVLPGALRSGDLVVLPTDRGLLDEFGWNPDSSSPVMDVSLRDNGLPLDADALKRLCGVTIDKGLIKTALGFVDDGEDVDNIDRRGAVEDILQTIAAAPSPNGDQAEWKQFVDSLGRQVLEARNEVPRLPVRHPVQEPRSNDLDETSLAVAAVELEPHGSAVAARARRIAERLGVELALVEIVERAGHSHDIGKADTRFQRWLDPEGKHAGVLMAKSDMPRHQWEAARINANWPRGGRHEALSARLVCQWLTGNTLWTDPVLRDLLLHLVVSHHGKGRPLVSPVDDGTLANVCGVIDGVSVKASADLSITDWDQPSRFRNLNAEFGPWGLALLEAVVRRADHAVSAGHDGGPMEVC